MPAKKSPTLRFTSWSGDADIEVVPGARERSPIRDLVLAAVILASVDLVTVVGLIIFSDSNRIVCGAHCYPNPAADLHDAYLALWVTGLLFTVTVGATLYWHRARVVAIVIQGAVLLGVLHHTLPVLHTANIQQRHLLQCQYGYRGPCQGITILS